ncbi:uncharacterized protein LOC131672431 [Phymastichus coffea]|uniref:uncharacterized protein LOC131672431 n=1 Tax=Phymastichus coffea TaxID=108790 RepID=UPI00273B37F4|nr:uncharacterized protein LOC131672431 [Phymastichus coffea]
MKKQYFFAISTFIYTIIGTNETLSDEQPVVEYYSFQDIQYVFFSQRVPWEEANILCISFDAKLAMLNTNLKATNVAQSMAESDIAMEGAWLGGRRIHSTWYWIDGINSSSSQYVIPLDPDIDDFPPWSQKPFRATKECLAIGRKSHSLPNFIDLDCRLLRPFVCEKKSDDSMKSPVPSKWVKINQHVYTLYHGRVTWVEAVIFCRAQGMRLAIINNQNVINALSSSMTQSRPDFENVWIGARYSYGQWIWLATGSILSSQSDNSGYPPWRFGKPAKNTGCLLLDRHLDDKPTFIEMFCEGKRDFVCEKYPEGELEVWMNKPIKFVYDNISVTVYPMEKTWDESRKYCEERGSVLSYINNWQLVDIIVTAMGDHPREISHIWLGGLYNLNFSEWRWIYNNEVIPANNNNMDFPPWANSIVDSDDFLENSVCLNLDRIDHTQPRFYGLNCDSKQAFACTTNCENPPPVANGTWNCIGNSYNIKDTLNTCSLQCDEGYFTAGKKNVDCSPQNGWFNQSNWLEFPVCLDMKNYWKRFTRSLRQDMQKASGYYILLSHSNEKFNHLGLQLTRKLLTLFPLNAQRRMGMTNYFKTIRNSIPFNQSDTCTALQLLLPNDKLQSKEYTNELNYTDWFSDIKVDGRNVLIIAILDSIVAKHNQEILYKLKMAGHSIVVIGLDDDWESLTPLATVRFDGHFNTYLFNEEGFETVIGNLKRVKDQHPICKENNDSLTGYTVVHEPSRTFKVTTTLQPEQITENNVNILTSIDSLISQMATEIETNSSEKNPIQSNEKTTVISENSNQNIDVNKNLHERDSNETDESPIDTHESILSDNLARIKSILSLP